MSTRIQIIILIALIFIFAFMIFHIYKKKLEFRFCLPWMLFMLVCIVLTCFPSLLSWFAGVVGIATPINMLFLCGFVLALFIIYILTVAVSKLTANVSLLTQKIAILEKELADRQEKDSKQN